MSSIDSHINLAYKYNIIPEYIVEIGTRDGHDAEYYRKNFNLDLDRVFLFEPNPEKLQYILTTYPYSTLIPKAVSNSEGWKDFNQIVSPDDNLTGVSSLMFRPEYFTDPSIFLNKIKVQCITGLRFIQEYNLDNLLLKLDVEGHTYEVLDGFQDSIQSISSIHLEVEKNTVWTDQKVKTDVERLLEEKGFVKKEEFSIPIPNFNFQYDQIWINKKWLT